MWQGSYHFPIFLNIVQSWSFYSKTPLEIEAVGDVIDWATDVIDWYGIYLPDKNFCLCPQKHR